MDFNVPVCELSDAHFSVTWPDGLIEIDKEHKILRVNAQASEYLGWSAQEFIGETVHKLLCCDSSYCDHHEMACPFISVDACSLSAKERYWVHKEQHSVAVNYRLVPTTKKTLLVIFQCCDVLGYQVDELRKLSAFTEINPAPLLEVDEQGLILFSNPAMTNLMLIFGFDDNGVSNVLPEHLPDIVRRCLASESEVEGIESDAIDEDDPDDHRYFLWQLNPIRSLQSRSVLLCGVDITHKKQAERQQTLFIETLEQEKAKARKEYLAKMVHELRSPLNAVVGYASLLKQKLEKVVDDKYISLFDRIIEGGNHLAEQISMTLESSRVESGTLHADISEFKVNSIVHTLVSRFVIMGEKKGLTVSTQIPENLLSVKADMSHFEQVIINLLSNAIKYTPEGSIEIILSEVDDVSVGQAVSVAVKDTGSGISDSEKEGVFELFKRQTSHENTSIQGDGLGLAICVEMMNLNNGRIALESTLNVGSTFSAIFPKA